MNAYHAPVRPSHARTVGWLVVGVLAVGSAGVLLKAAEAPSATLAAYRLLGGGLPLLTWAAVRGQLRAVGRGAGWLLLAQVALAGHFLLWIASLRDTSVAASVVLVTMQPVFALPLAWAWGEGWAPRSTLYGVALAAAGVAVMAGGDALAGGPAVRGDALAIGGAACAAVYLVAGRRLRARVGVVAYAGAAYSGAGCLVLAYALARGLPLTGFSLHTWALIGAVTLGPQLTGHTALNWALGYLRAETVATAVLGEPVVATALAAVALGERPTAAQWVGGVVILGGVWITVRGELRAVRATVPIRRERGGPG